MKFNWHKINFYEYCPLPVHSLALCKTSMKIAVARCDRNSAFVEIWNITKTWFVEQTLVAVKSIESLIWFDSRIFSVGLDDLILEYSLKNGFVKKKVNSFNGPIWCVCANMALKMLAVGTDLGTIVLFDVNDELSFKHSLMKQKDPIFSICWHEQSNLIVVGGVDIRVWSVDTLQMIQKISVAKDILIWALALSSDFTIVSGDSTGHTCFWIGKPGSLLYSKRFRSHDADIHSISFSPDERSVHVGGIDCLMRFQLTTKKDDSLATWVMSSKMNYHMNDIRSVVYAGDTVISAGLDCNIIVNDLLNKNFFKVFPFPQLPIAHLMPGINCILLQYYHHLEIWKLGKTNQDFDKSGIELNLKKEEIKLLSLNVGNSYISCSAASNCGSYISYSNHCSTFLYKLNFIKNTKSQNNCLTELGGKVLNKVASTCILFSANSMYLICASRYINIKIFLITEDAIDCKYMIQNSVLIMNSPLTIMAVNTSNKYLAIADILKGVVIYNIKKQKVFWSLPARNSNPLCIAFHPSNPNLILIAYSDKMIIEADIKQKSYTSWCRKFLKNAPKSWMHNKSCIKRIFYNLANHEEIFVQDEKGFYIIRKQEFLNESSIKNETNSIINNNIKHLLYMNVLDEKNIVTIERTPEDIIESLPPPFKKHKFGV